LSEQAYSAAESPPAAAASRAARASRWGTLYNVRRWELAVGSAASTQTSGHGTRNVRDRLAAIGGRVEFHSEPGRGTILAGVVPLRDL
jgi:hypothetical protein